MISYHQETTSSTLRRAILLRRVAGLEERKQALLKKFPKLDLDTLNKLILRDPTAPKYSYLEWLVKKYLKGEINDTNIFDIRELLTAFDQVKRSEKWMQKTQIPSGSIDDYSISDLVDLRHSGWFNEIFVNGKSLGTLRQGAAFVYDTPPWRVIRVGGLSEDADACVKTLMYYGRDTYWCTRKEESAKSYLRRGPVFVIFKDNKKYAQSDGREVKNVDNQTIDLREDVELWRLLASLRIVNRLDYVRELLRHPNVLPTEKELDYLKDHPVEYLQFLMFRQPPVSPQEWQHFENSILGKPELVYLYLVTVKRERWPKGESTLAKSPEWAFQYLRYFVASGTWPQGEKTVSRSPEYAFKYAIYVNKARWPKGEPAIKKNPDLWRQYCEEFGIPNP